MAGLLVSVRSAEEARSAVIGGASVVDVKEPDRGPLGRADPETWAAVRAIVPGATPVSVALGEMKDWRDLDPRPFAGSFAGVAYRKLGLAGCGSIPDWAERWSALRARFGPGPDWIAVVYADWQSADAPEPDAVLDAAEAAGCVGILVDTWDKRCASPVDLSWRPWFERARARLRLIALAGGLDAAGMARQAPLDPDLFAVRGAACIGADRLSVIEAGRVAALARTAREIGAGSGAGRGLIDHPGDGISRPTA